MLPCHCPGYSAEIMDKKRRLLSAFLFSACLACLFLQFQLCSASDDLKEQNAEEIVVEQSESQIVEEGECQFSEYLDADLSDDSSQKVAESEGDVQSRIIVEDVSILSKENFTAFVEGNQYSMILFLYPNAEELAPGYREAAVLFKHSVTFGKVDAIAEVELAQKYNLQGDSRIYFFGDSGQLLYDGPITRDNISEWIQKRLRPAVVNITSKLDAEAVFSGTNASSIAVAFLYNLEDIEAQELASAARFMEDVQFYQTSEKELAELFGLDKCPALAFFNEGHVHHYDGKFERQQLLELFTMTKLPSITLLNRDNAALASDPSTKKLLLFASSGDFENLFPAYDASAKAFNEKVLFLYVNTSRKEEAEPLLESFGLTSGKPVIMASEQGERYVFDNDITADNLKVFVEDFLAGHLKLGPSNEKTGNVTGKEAVRPTRLPPVGLDEYRRRTILEMQKVLESQMSSESDNISRFQIQHRVEPGGEEYNYAAASHGAKVVSANKEAKGAGNVLVKDSDKYLRNPCSAAEKFVVVELSEETLVDIIVIANYEFYSANLKDFELLGSLTYPTEDWKYLGRFEAENVRHSQKFSLGKPDWVKYLKVKMLSHYGTEFFCTLSTIEVYGVDAIERLLEDWIGKSPSASLHPETPHVDGTVLPTAALALAPEVDDDKKIPANADHGRTGRKWTLNLTGDKERDDSSRGTTETYVQGSRSTADSVIKILMQKVKALELDQNLFDKYLENLNSDYKALFTDFDQELATVNERLQELSKTIQDLHSYVKHMEQKWETEKEDLEFRILVHTETEAVALKLQRELIERMANRELVAYSLGLLSMLLCTLWFLISGCTLSNNDSEKSSACGSSNFLIFLLSFFVVIILSA